MWAHRPWVGRFFPSGTKPGTELPLYARWCNAVEGNITFYAEPSTTTIEKWSEQAPDEMCLSREIGRVVLDSRALYATPADSDAARDERRSKPDLPIVLDAVGKFPIIRVIGEDSPDGTLAGITVWVDQVIAWIGEGREPYVFAHQPENLDSPGLARAFHEAVAARLPTLAPLPEPPGQASMF